VTTTYPSGEVVTQTLRLRSGRLYTPRAMPPSERDAQPAYAARMTYNPQGQVTQMTQATTWRRPTPIHRTTRGLRTSMPSGQQPGSLASRSECLS